MTDASTITSIVFTRLKNAAALVELLGAQTCERILEAHHRQSSTLIDEYAGKELQWMGDGMMAAFRNPEAAVGFASALQRAAKSAEQEGRFDLCVGIEVGDVLLQESGSGYFGSTVVVAARLCARAEPGQIVVSSLVADLVGPSAGHRFRDLGIVKLKGIEDRVEIAEIVLDPA